MRMPRRPVFIGVAVFVALICGTAVYPVVHEAGHYLLARICGVEVHGGVWTVWQGRPHVSLGPTTPAARAWVDAGGLLVPTVAGLLWLLIWAQLLHRLAGPLAVVLWIPGVCLLAGNFGTIFEALSRSRTCYRHLSGMAQQCGLSGGAAVLGQVLPAVCTGLVLAWSLVVLRGRLRPHGTTGRRVGEAGRPM